jgi:hypothetical protein
MLNQNFIFEYSNLHSIAGLADKHGSINIFSPCKEFRFGDYRWASIAMEGARVFTIPIAVTIPIAFSAPATLINTR